MTDVVATSVSRRGVTGRPSDKELPVEAEDKKLVAESDFIDPDGTVTNELKEDDDVELFLNPTLTAKPADKFKFRHQITHAKFMSIVKDMGEVRSTYKKSNNHYMSLLEIFKYVCKKYIGQLKSESFLEELLNKHREWQREFTLQTGNSDIGDELMLRKVFELFSVGVKRKVD